MFHFPLRHLACLCSGMKLLITPLLSGLLENDFTKMTEFDDFFKEIEKINRKKVITVLYSLSSLLCSGKLQGRIFSQTLWFESHLQWLDVGFLEGG